MYQLLSYVLCSGLSPRRSPRDSPTAGQQKNTCKSPREDTVTQLCPQPSLATRTFSCLHLLRCSQSFPLPPNQFPRATWMRKLWLKGCAAWGCARTNMSLINATQGNG